MSRASPFADASQNLQRQTLMRTTYDAFRHFVYGGENESPNLRTIYGVSARVFTYYSTQCLEQIQATTAELRGVPDPEEVLLESVLGEKRIQETNDESGFLIVENAEVKSAKNAPPLNIPLPTLSTAWSIVRGATTAGLLGHGMLVNAFPYIPSTDAYEAASQMRLANLGAMLSAYDINRFLSKISPTRDPKLNIVHDYYFSDNSGINLRTFAEISALLTKFKAEIKRKELPICIPVTFEAQGVFDRQHIALILIKDDIVDYFDPLGIPSKERPLADPTMSLRDVLDYCREQFTTQSEPIFEPPFGIQYDANNCGVLILKHLYERAFRSPSPPSSLAVIEENEPEAIFEPAPDSLRHIAMGSLRISAPSLAELMQFRKIIHDTTYPFNKLEE